MWAGASEQAATSEELGLGSQEDRGGTESLAQKRPLGRGLMTWIAVVVLSICISEMGPARGAGESREGARAVTTGGNRLGGQGSEAQETWERGCYDGLPWVALGVALLLPVSSCLLVRGLEVLYKTGIRFGHEICFVK